MKPEKRRTISCVSLLKRSYDATEYVDNMYLCNIINKKGENDMARPIKETPILHGEDARRFLARMAEGRKETPEQRERRIANYKLLKSRFVK